MIWLVASLGPLIASPSASLLQAPKPLNYTSWPELSGVPFATVFKGGGWARTIRTTLIVKQDGSVQNCEVEKSTGHKDLDDLVCAMFQQRAKFRPAVWIDGSPSYGMFRFTFKIYRDERRSSKSDPVDLNVRVDRKAYAGQVLPALVRVAFAVDQHGQTGDCVSDTPIDSSTPANPTSWVPVACQAIIQRYVPAVAKDDLGKPLRSVQNAIVRISAD